MTQATQKLLSQLHDDLVCLKQFEQTRHETIETVNGREQITIHHIQHETQQYLVLAKFTLDCSLLIGDAVKMKPINSALQKYKFEIHRTVIPHFTKIGDYLNAIDTPEIQPCIETEIALTVLDKLTDEEKHTLSFPPRYDNSSGMFHFAKCFNQVIADIRDLYFSPLYQTKLRRRNKHFKKMFKRCVSLVKRLFMVFARLLVVRLDFGIKQQLGAAGQSSLASIHNLPYLKDKITHLLDNSRHSRVLKHKIGYILRFEHGERKGFHVHGFFFFDGSKHHQDISLAQQISDEWMRITEGQGTCHICNMNKYRYPAIGIINHIDEQKISYLFDSIRYVCKSEQFLKYTELQQKRAFQISHPPKPKKSSGRPRKFAESSQFQLLGA